jgi:hypothetical protein
MISPGKPQDYRDAIAGVTSAFIERHRAELASSLADGSDIDALVRRLIWEDMKPHTPAGN